MSVMWLIRKPSVKELRDCVEKELKKLRETPRTMANGENLEQLIGEYQSLLDDCNDFLREFGDDGAAHKHAAINQTSADILARFTAIKQ